MVWNRFTRLAGITVPRSRMRREQPVDDLAAHQRGGLDPHRERRDVGDHHVLRGSASPCLSAACTAAPRATASSGGRLPQRQAAEELGRQAHHAGHARGAADQQHLVDLVGPQLGVAQRPLIGAADPLQQLRPRLLHLRAGERQLQVDRRAVRHWELGERDAGLLDVAQPPLGVLAGLAQPGPADADARAASRPWRACDPGAISAAITSTKSSPPSRESPADAWISITPSMISSTVTSKVPPPRSSTTARSSRLPLVEAIGEGGGGGLVEDALDAQPGDLAGGAGGLPLRVVEVGGHGDRPPPRPARRAPPRRPA